MCSVRCVLTQRAAESEAKHLSEETSLGEELKEGKSAIYSVGATAVCLYAKQATNEKTDCVPCQRVEEETKPVLNSL